MKKTLKKLTLNRETLLSLDRLNLERAAGGASTDCTYTNCCSGYNTCGTCACGPTQTGGSRYC